MTKRSRDHSESDFNKHKFRRISQDIDDLTRSLKYFGVDDDTDNIDALIDDLNDVGLVDNIYYGVYIKGKCFNNYEKTDYPYKFFSLINKNTGLVEYLFNTSYDTQCYLERGSLKSISSGTILISSIFSDIDLSDKRGNIYAQCLKAKKVKTVHFKNKFDIVIDRSSFPYPKGLSAFEISEFNNILDKTEYIDTRDKLENFRKKIDIEFENDFDKFRCRFVFIEDGRKKSKKNRKSKKRRKSRKSKKKSRK